jgi:CRISPR system Cascade subunit CasA
MTSKLNLARCRRAAGYLVLNLIHASWLPVIRRNTGRCVIRPSQLSEHCVEDPVIAIDWPRPDFRIATFEFLVGLLATACPPECECAWLARWRKPPEPAALEEAFAPLAHAFALDGDGPRFLQDLEDLAADREPVERLLIEAPGDSTTNKNTDLMIHRDRIASLGRPAAAIALYTFQSWSPAGGAGNRTGLRGGGPLVTMVLPGPSPTLWQTIWANVPVGDASPTTEADLPRVFPWLAPTVTSESGRPVTPQTAHKLQCWWGMPRRIRLDFSTAETPRSCDLTGAADLTHVVSWRQRPHGVKYTAWGRLHPLTPHYRQKGGPEWLAVHPHPGGIGYRDWLGLVLSSADGLRLPAATVSAWRNARALDTGVSRARFLAAGFDMDNMKARGFVESEMPLPAAADQVARDRVDDLARALVQAADQVANLLRFAVRNALFSAGSTVKSDVAVLNVSRERLWEQTDTAFFVALEYAADKSADAAQIERAKWLQRLRQVALVLFDEAAPLSPDSGNAAAPRIARARRFLGFALSGCGTAGAALLTTLDLPLPEPRESKNKKKRKAP